MWRRAVSKRSVVVADRDHLHHRLLNMGYSQRQAVVLMYSVSGFFGASAITLSRLTPNQASLMLALIFTLAYVGARRAGLLGAASNSAAARREILSAAAQAAAGRDETPGPADGPKQ